MENATIKTKCLVDEISRLQKDKRFRDNEAAIEALEAVKSWSAEDPFEDADSEKDGKFKKVSSTSDMILGTPTKDCADVFVVPGDGGIDHNICVVGPSGSGKTWNFLLTNILQVAKKQSSFFVIDVGGRLYKDAAGTLKEQGYTVLLFNDKRQPAPERFDFAMMQESLYACFCAISEFDPDTAVSAQKILNDCLDCLVACADGTPDKKLETPIYFFLDEFTNLGSIDAFRNKLASCARRGMYISIMFQSIHQLKAVYPDDWERILFFCKSILCLGAYDPVTLEIVDQLIKGAMLSLGHKAAKEPTPHHFQRHLMEKTSMVYESKYPELTSLKPDECLIITPGFEPFKLFKFNPQNHPLFPETV